MTAPAPISSTSTRDGAVRTRRGSIRPRWSRGSIAPVGQRWIGQGRFALLGALLATAACVQAEPSPRSLAFEATRATAEIALADIAMREAWGGAPNAFTYLRSHCDALATSPARLAAALPLQGKPGEIEALRQKLDRTTRYIEDWARDCVAVAESREAVLAAHDVLAQLNRVTPLLQARLDHAGVRLSDGAGSAAQVHWLTRLTVLWERIRAGARTVLETGPHSVAALDRLARDSMMFARVLNALIEHDAELQIPVIEDADAMMALHAVRGQFEALRAPLTAVSNAHDLPDTGLRIVHLTRLRGLVVFELHNLPARAP